MVNRRVAEKAFIVFLVAAVATSGWFVFFYNFGGQVNGDLQPVATVELAKNLVKRRPQTKLGWEDSPNGTPLFNADSVYTSDGARAVVAFNDGSKLTLDENSLVKIDFNNERISIGIERGSVSGSMNGGKEYEFTQGDKKLNLANGRGDVRVRSGKFSLVQGSGQLTEGNIVRPLEAPLAVKAPRLGATLPYLKGKKIRLEWIPRMTAKNQKYKVIVASDVEFAKPIKTFETGRSFADVAFPDEGDYYWQVTQVGVQGSIESNFALEAPQVPNLLYPEDEQTLARAEQGELIWQVDESEDKKYLVEVARDAEFKQKVKSSVVERLGDKLPALASGLYFWRVRVVPLEGNPHPWSEVGKFYFGDANVADLAFPKNEEVVTLAQGQKSLTLEWSGLAPQGEAIVDIAADSKFTQIISTGKVKGRKFEWQVSKSGDYYWRVRPSKASQPGAEFKFAKFKLLVPKKLRAPQIEKEYRFQLPHDNGTGYKAPRDLFRLVESFFFGTAYTAERGITLQWPAIVDAKAYEVEIAQDQNFRSIVLKTRTNTNKLLWKEQRPGAYFLRVAAVDETGLQSDFSAPGRIVLNGPAPRLISPRNNHVIELNQATATVAFQWDKSKAKRYILQVSQSPRFKGEVISQPVSANRASKELKEGAYFWRVGAVYFDGGETVYSQPHRLEVKLPGLLPPPMLVSPQDGAEIDIGMFPYLTQFKIANVNGVVTEIELTKYIDEVESRETFETTSTVYTTSLEEADYEWRARTRDSFGRWGAWSTVRKFSTLLPEPPPPPPPRVVEKKEPPPPPKVVKKGPPPRKLMFDFSLRPKRWGASARLGFGGITGKQTLNDSQLQLTGEVTMPVAIVASYLETSASADFFSIRRERSPYRFWTGPEVAGGFGLVNKQDGVELGSIWTGGGYWHFTFAKNKSWSSSLGVGYEVSQWKQIGADVKNSIPEEESPIGTAGSVTKGLASYFAFELNPRTELRLFYLPKLSGVHESSGATWTLNGLKEYGASLSLRKLYKSFGVFAHARKMTAKFEKDSGAIESTRVAFGIEGSLP